MNGQTQRLIAVFQEHPNTEIASPDLHRQAAASMNGYCASMSRRIFEARQYFAQNNLGELVKSKDEYVGTERRTGYTFISRPVISSVEDAPLILGREGAEQI